ncbi:ParB/RepB/Spo0J family partition protein [Hydrogenovibrio sp. JE_KL2]|jgi:ParB family chromosome partitioning protein|uniref:ParB/RepB/Spo0J family partition protein n=1 Tax=Hydrogenovibrio sp. JE_KL2 TaxID=2651188 RepID=UPI00128CE907|nr:ParB/RepB/Spo0J family partition protein [Hydrogenovibrio sp. JE_KL2]MBN2607132.1 ParB/RepB/Spo0J family partition protein [Thiotrichales bacterium]MPQ76469.1 ParB/RepB/Spo0J family partition protein [Hydrogenovibrio sp. JE_KL2]
MAKKRGMGLGGVRALYGAKQKAESNVSDLRIEKVSIDHLKPGVYQPRYKFDQEALSELADSIRLQGIVQPIVVKVSDEDNTYEIIAGERRWRAAKIAGLTSVPVVIRQADNQATLAMALIENIQREDLNPIETALGLKRLMKEFELTQQAVADAVGRSRTAVTNLLRLLKLPEKVQEWLHNGDLTMGHARAIITLPENLQLELAQKSIAKNWTVRDMEQAVQAILVPKNLKKAKKPQLAAHYLEKQEQISEKMATKVKINHGANGKGKIELAFSSEEELQRLLEHLS